MKRVFLYALVLLFFVKCNQEDKNKENNAKFYLSGEITGAPDSVVFLQDYIDGEWAVLDSTPIVDGHFELTGKYETPRVLYLGLNSGKRKLISFFTDSSRMKLEANYDSLKNIRITGSSVNNMFRAYKDSISVFEQRSKSLYKEYLEAQKNQDPAQIKKIEAEYESVYNQQEQFSKNYVWQNNASFITPYILIRSLSYSMEYNELDSFLNHFDKKLAKSVYYKQISDRVKVLKSVAIGKAAPEIELADTAGNLIRLSSFKGKYIVIDFWASWCGPCRRDNPGNVALYKEYKDKGFEFFGVSFDETKEDWVKAIEKDGITWTQVSDLKGWNCAAGKTYGVRAIPHTVLLDTMGIIIAKNVRGDDLRKKIEELLN